MILSNVLICIFCITGNLYSREVQIDGEQLAIQVQDTPGVQVSNVMRDTGTVVPNAIECHFFNRYVLTGHLSHAAFSRVRSVE